MGRLDHKGPSASKGRSSGQHAGLQVQPQPKWRCDFIRVHLHVRFRVTGEIPQHRSRGVGRECDIYVGQQFISECEEADLRVPQDIAVLAADEDEFLAHTTYPPLSTIDIDSHRVGYEAGRTLALPLRGEQVDVPVQLIPPRRVISRQSTDVVAVDDPLLSRAMRFIQDNYDEAINVEDAIHAVKINRRTLERRFKATFGRTPGQMIQDVRLKEVCRLLATSPISIEQIAQVTGFSSPAHLSHAFRKAAGMTLGKFRKTKG